MRNSPQFLFELNSSFFNTFMNPLEHFAQLGNIRLDPLTSSFLLNLALTDSEQSLFWPFAEPIERAAVD
jgi:hypothetical protein